MKYYRLIGIGVIIVILCILILRDTGRYQLGIEEKVDMSRFQMMTVDQSGNIYGVYLDKTNQSLYKSTGQYLMKITSDGQIGFAMALEDKEEAVKDIQVDSQGNIYVHYIHYMYDRLRVDSEEIIMYTSSGRNEEGLCKYKYEYQNAVSADSGKTGAIRFFKLLDDLMDAVVEKLEEVGRHSWKEIVSIAVASPLYEVGSIKNMEVSKDQMLYFYTSEAADGQSRIRVMEHLVKEDSLAEKDMAPIQVPYSEIPLFIAGNQEGAMWYGTKDGSLYFVDENGASIYTVVDESLEVYTITDLIFWQSEEVDTSDESGSLVVEIESMGKRLIYRGTLEKGFSKVAEMDFSERTGPLALTEKGDIYYQIGEAIYSINSHAISAMTGTVSYTPRYYTLKAIHMTMIGALVLLSVVLLYLIYRDILKGWTSVVLKQSLLMIGIFTVFALVLMYYTEEIILDNASKLDRGTIEIFENIVGEKLEDTKVVSAIETIGYLAELKTGKLKEIYYLIEKTKTDSEAQIQLSQMVEVIYTELVDKGIVTPEDTSDTALTPDLLTRFIEAAYADSLETINELSEDQINELKSINIEEDAVFIALYNVIKEADKIIDAATIVNTNDGDRTINQKDIILYIGEEEDQKAYTEGRYVSNYSSDNKWIRTGRMIETETGGHYIFRIGMNAKGYISTMVMKDMNALNAMMRLMIFFTVILLLVSIRINLNPIKVLTREVSAIEAYDTAPTIGIESRDEIGRLSEAFNQLLLNIKAKFKEQIETSKVYARYVPLAYESYLGKKILALTLGDFCEKEMTVMSFYVHDMFDVIASFNSQKEAFIFIKDYLDKISVLVREHSGVVTHYQDGGVTAIFEVNENALAASGDINRFIRSQNKTSQRNLNIGIGLNRGNLLLGVVGEESRMQLSVISKNANIAYDLAKRTKSYSSQILATYEVVRDRKSTIQYCRWLGFIQPNSTDQKITVYDYYESDMDAGFKNKETTKKILEEGVRLYQAGDFMEARYRFREVLEDDRHDLVAQKYYFLADGYKLMKKNEIPDWCADLK